MNGGLEGSADEGCRWIPGLTEATKQEERSRPAHFASGQRWVEAILAARRLGRVAVDGAREARWRFSA